MKTPSQNFAHHTEVKKHPFGVKTPNLATLFYFLFVYFVTQSLHSAIQAATAISVFNSFKSETAPFPAQKNQNPPPIFTIKKWPPCLFFIAFLMHFYVTIFVIPTQNCKNNFFFINTLPWYFFQIAQNLPAPKNFSCHTKVPNRHYWKQCSVRPFGTSISIIWARAAWSRTLARSAELAQRYYKDTDVDLARSRLGS